MSDGRHFDVFIRRWWKEATTPGWPDNLEPGPGRKRYLARRVTEGDARRICEQYNKTHKPGRYSLKAEYESR